jgi:hypothetical protein
MIVKTTQTYRFTLADGSTVNVSRMLSGGDRRPWVASPQTVPDGITADPLYALAVADGSLVVEKIVALSGVPTVEAFGATPL